MVVVDFILWVARTVAIAAGGLAFLHILVRFDFFVPHAIRLIGDSPPLRQHKQLATFFIGLAILSLWAVAFVLPLFFIATQAVPSKSRRRSSTPANR